MNIKLPIILLAATLIGAGGGVAARIGSESLPAKEAHGEAPAEGADKEEKETDAGDDHGGQEKKPKKARAAKVEESTYFKFSRQFVAPLVVAGEPTAMIILDVAIELSPGAGEGVYSDEPRLRDSVLKALLAQSANGDLAGMFANPERLESTRAAVLDRVKSVLGDDAKSVLLIDVGYQPY